jgi:hypothetical protein
MLVRAPPIMEWMLHKFGQKVFLPKTRVLGAYMVQVVCLFYSIQKTNNKEDNVDAVPKVKNQWASKDCKL